MHKAISIPSAHPNLCELLSVISSRLTDDDLEVAASVTRVASSRSPAVLSMVAEARSSKTIDAATVAVAFFWGEEDMSSIDSPVSSELGPSVFSSCDFC